MAELGKTIDKLNHQKLSDKQVYDYINALFPLADNASELQKKKPASAERRHEGQIF